MSTTLNIIGALAILWVIFHAIWNIGNFENFSGDLLGVQRFEGFFALAVGIALIAVVIKLRQR